MSDDSEHKSDESSSARGPDADSLSQSTDFALFSEDSSSHTPSPFSNADAATEIHRAESSEPSSKIPEEDQPTVISKTDDPAKLAKQFRRPAEAAQHLLGTMLDHYRLDSFIGGGGMGAVFRAEDTLLGRTVAVKILSRGDGEQELLKRFVNEAQSAAQLDHENIARVFFVGQALGWNYIVFEYVEGKNIRQLVADRGPMDLPLALRYMAQMTRALEHAGDRQVVHRDIKPSNVIVTPDHRVKLVDMGLARMRRIDRDQEDLTASGMTLGTFDYISPEQARDPRSADTRSDIYSLGCTFFFMLTGLPPFPDGTPLQKLLSHQEADRPDPKTFRPDLPDEVVAIVRRQLEPNPSKRYQTANELLADLLIAASKLGIDMGLKESLIIEPVQTSAGWFSRSLPILVPALLLIAAIAAAEFYAQPGSASDDFEPVYDRVARREIPTDDVPTATDRSSTNDENESNGNEDIASEPSSTGNSSSNEGETSSSAGPAETMGTGTLTSIRVGQDLDADDGSVDVPSLEEALALANVDEDITEIQLCFDGTLTVDPLEIFSPKLRLVAGPGFRPKLSFVAGDGRMSSPHLIKIYCQEFELRGIDLQLTLSSDGSFRQVNWFHIAQDYGDRNVELSEPPLQDFDFIDCRFTVSESPSSDPDALPTTTLLHINRPREFFLSLPSVDVAQRPNLLLRRTLVRGDCHLIRSTPATPFYLMWEQSLFVSQQVAIQLGGVAQVESGEDPLVALNASRLELRSVTSTSPGIVEVRVTSSDPETPQFSLDARRCWFSLAEGEAVVHHRLLTEVANDEDLFTLSGQENLYASSTLLWQLDIAGQVDRFVPLQDASFAANWYQQRLNESHLSMPSVWRQFLSGRMPRAEVTVDDLRSAIQEVELSGVRRMGVDPNELAMLDSMSEVDSRSEPESEF